MKKILLLSILAIVAFSCDKDKDLPNLDYQFDVKTQNKNVEFGLEVNKTIDLDFEIKKEYQDTTDVVTYELISNKVGFEAKDNQGNENIELNKQYKIKTPSLKISYKGTERGEHKVKVVFKNKRDVSVEKEISLFFDGFGFNAILKEKEMYIGMKNIISYHLSKKEKLNSNYYITIIEDEAQGKFIITENGEEKTYKKGDSFSVSEGDGEIGYITEKPTVQGKESDKIVLQVKSDGGDYVKNIELDCKNLFMNFTVNAAFNFEENPIIFPNKKIPFLINIEEENPNGVNTDYDYIVDLSESWQSHDFSGDSFTFPRAPFTIYKDGKKVEDNYIYVKKGQTLLELVQEVNFNTEIKVQGALNISVSNKIYGDKKKKENYFSNQRFWKYPVLNFRMMVGGSGGKDFIRIFKKAGENIFPFEGAGKENLYTIKINTFGAECKGEVEFNFHEILPPNITWPDRGFQYMIPPDPICGDNKSLEGVSEIKIYHAKYGLIMKFKYRILRVHNNNDLQYDDKFLLGKHTIRDVEYSGEFK